MSNRARNVILLSLTVFGIVLAVLGFIALRGGVEDTSTAKPQPGTPIARAIAASKPASKPFQGLNYARLGVGGRCLRVVVADQDSERVQGLRGLFDLGGYDGMLFVYGQNSNARFTMSGTPLALDIVWYDETGRPVSNTTMQPCMDGTDSTCPIYASQGAYRYALETQAGHGGGASTLGACPA